MRITSSDARSGMAVKPFRKRSGKEVPCIVFLSPVFSCPDEFQVRSKERRRNKKKKGRKEKKRKEKRRKKNIERRAKEVKEEGRREWNTSRTGKKRLCPIGELYGLGMGHSVPLSDPL